jgi:hypothetical protein
MLLATLAMMPATPRYKLYKAPFDNDVLEYRPFPADSAKKLARTNPRLQDVAGALIRAFHPHNLHTGKLASIRLAAYLGDKWLLADSNGLAKFGNAFGWIDVVSAERSLRRITPVHSWSMIVVLEVDNLSRNRIAICDSTGRRMTEIGTRAHKRVITWITWHKVWRASGASEKFLAGPGVRSATSPGSDLRTSALQPLSKDLAQEVGLSSPVRSGLFKLVVLPAKSSKTGAVAPLQ